MYLINKSDITLYSTYTLSFDSDTNEYLITGKKNGTKIILFVSAFKFIAIMALKKMNKKKYR